MKRVLFLFGGKSNEHDVSIVSATSVYKNFPVDSYECVPVYINKENEWYSPNTKFGELPKTKEEIINLFDQKINLKFDGGNLFFVNNALNNDCVEKLDYIFPIIHGSYGEDGVLQGFAKSFNLKIVGPSMETAFTTFDKDITKNMLKNGGVNVASGTTWYTDFPYPDYKKLCLEFGQNLFIKPARSGSSVGVSFVKNEAEFVAGLEKASKEDNKVLIEKAIVGREIEVAVFVKENGERIISKVIGEILPPEDNFYTYEEKYANESKTGLVVGASFTEDEEKQIYETVDKTIAVLNIIGSARVDMFLPKNSPPILNEVNTIPGFTSISMYPKLFEASGVNFKDLIKLMIDNAS